MRHKTGILFIIILVCICSAALTDGYKFDMDTYLEFLNKKTGFVYEGEPVVVMQTWDSDEYEKLRLTAEMFMGAKGEKETVVSEAQYNSTGFYDFYLPVGEYGFAYLQEIKGGQAGEEIAVGIPDVIRIRDDLELVGYPDIIHIGEMIDPGVNTLDYEFGFVHYDSTAKCSLEPYITPTHPHIYSDWPCRRFVWGAILADKVWYSSRPKIITVLPVDSLMIPDSTSEICREAFAGCAYEGVYISKGCERIESRAFADSPNLYYACIPAETQIADDAFDGCSKNFRLERY